MAPQTHGHEFWDAELLRRPGERSRGFVVHCMDLPVEAFVLVMDEVPNEVLCVEEEENGQAVDQDLGDGRSVLRQLHRRKYEGANDNGRENEDEVVGQRQEETLAHHSQRGLPVLLDLETVQQRNLLSQEIQNGKRQTEEEVTGKCKNHWEKGRRDERPVLEEETVPERLQQMVRGPGVLQQERQRSDVQHLDVCSVAIHRRFCLFIQTEGT